MKSKLDRIFERTLAGLADSARHHSELCYRTKTSDSYQKDFILIKIFFYENPKSPAFNVSLFSFHPF